MHAGIEGTLSQGVRAFGMRRSRCIGWARTGLQQACTAAAMNVSRIVNWLEQNPRAKTRVTRFAALAQATRFRRQCLTYIATWQGFVYVAFVVDAYARRIVGWRVSRTAPMPPSSWTPWNRPWLIAVPQGGGLVHHSDHGAQYVSIRYTERLAEAGIEPSVGSVGDSYDNALAESVNGLYKT